MWIGGHGSTGKVGKIIVGATGSSPGSGTLTYLAVVSAQGAPSSVWKIIPGPRTVWLRSLQQVSQEPHAWALSPDITQSQKDKYDAAYTGEVPLPSGGLTENQHHTPGQRWKKKFFSL